MLKSFISSALAAVASLIIKLLDLIKEFLSKFTSDSSENVTETDIRDLIFKGSQTGVIEKGEEKIVSKVFRLGDRPANSIMTPRQEIVWLDANDPIEKIWKEVSESDYTYFPLADGDIEKVIGIISTKDLSSYIIRHETSCIKSLAKEPLRLPSNLTALQVLDRFKHERKHIALLIDEFGGIDGILTTHDLMEAMVGDLRDTDESEPSYVKRQDGSLLVDAGVDLDDLFTLLNLPTPDHEDHKGYHSLGGFMLKNLGHVPQIAEKFEFSGYIFEVTQMDRHRVNKIQIRKKEGKQKAA
jgi:putative hemolysin